MFTAAVEEIFKRMNIDAGINLNGVRPNNLRFADDIILFAESEEKLTDMLGDLNNEDKRDGMKLIKKKTKIVCFHQRVSNIALSFPLIQSLRTEMFVTFMVCQ